MQSTAETKHAVDADELLVLWQQPSTRAMLPVAILEFDGTTYRFRYIDGADGIEGFRALLGFPEFDRLYESQELFPLFQERVLDTSRSDFVSVIEGLALDPSLATPWEQLVHTGGTSEGDTIQVTPFPRATADGWECMFLAAGLRYFQHKSVRTDRGITKTYSSTQFEDLLASLSPGDSLDVELEVENDYNNQAQLLFHDGNVVAYLPDWLARLTAPWVSGGNSVAAKIVRINEPGAGWHLRLMASVSTGEPFGAMEARLRGGETLRYS